MTLQDEINYVLSLRDIPTEEELENILYSDDFYHIFTDEAKLAIKQLPFEQQAKVFAILVLLYEISDANI